MKSVSWQWKGKCKALSGSNVGINGSRLDVAVDFFGFSWNITSGWLHLDGPC